MKQTLGTIAYDIYTDLKQMSDDSKIEFQQVVYWVSMIGNQLKYQHIGNRSSGAFLNTYVLPVQTSSQTTNPNVVAGRKYILLPTAIYDYNNDRGIDFIGYMDVKPGENRPTYTTFTRTTVKTAERLRYNPYENPKPTTPYFYRLGDYIYLLGIENIPVKQLEIGVYSTFNPIETIDPEAEFDFPQELLHVLKRQVLDLGRFSLMIPQERVNDGDSESAGSVPTQKLVSVQPQNNQQAQEE